MERRIAASASASRPSESSLRRQGTLERSAFNVFHYKEIRTNIVQGADVRMIQRGDGAGFLLEAGAVAFGEALDRDRAIQTRVASLPHFAHAARADPGFQDVGAELPPWLILHVSYDCKLCLPGNALRAGRAMLVARLPRPRRKLRGPCLNRTYRGIPTGLRLP
jgi:hypothetical protein